MTGATRGAGNAYPSGAPGFTSGFIEVHIVSCHFVFLYFLPVVSCPLVVEFVIFFLISRAVFICSSAYRGRGENAM